MRGCVQVHLSLVEAQGENMTPEFEILARVAMSNVIARIRQNAKDRLSGMHLSRNLDPSSSPQLNIGKSVERVLGWRLRLSFVRILLGLEHFRLPGH